MKTLIVIPARLQSTRLPQKMLLRETGKSLLEHTWRAVEKTPLDKEIVVATDSQEILDEVVRFGGNASMTSASHASGTDRVAEIARNAGDFDIVCNVQGDEPEIVAEHIALAVNALAQRPECGMATLATPLSDEKALMSPANVKVVFDHRNRALYFSRSPIPYPRAGFAEAVRSGCCWFQHVGLYAYRPQVLQELTGAAQSLAEVTESLEQLRALHRGITIHVEIVEASASGIDTPEDYEAFVRRMSNC